MPKYKVGDVAALFPKPSKPKTESGKKIQSLFEEFYKKPSNPSKKWKGQKQLEGKEKQVEVLINKENHEAVESKPKKKKRKFENSIAPNSVEDATTQDFKRPKVEATTVSAPFPRNKFKKGRSSVGESFFPKKNTAEKDSELDNIFPKRKMMHSDDEDSFPSRKEKYVSIENDTHSSPQKKKKDFRKKAQSTLTTQDEGMESPNMNAEKPKRTQAATERRKKKKEKQRARKAFIAQGGSASDFLKLNPDVPEEQKSKVIFRMKKKRVIPSCEEVFGNQEDAVNRDTSDEDELTDKGHCKLSDQKVKGSGRERIEETEERVSRTLFVGNLPMSTTKKSLEKLFSPFGRLDSCRLRGAVPTKSSIPLKVAEIRRKYHSGLNSRIGYVVLKERKNAITAMSLSGTLIDGHHIVVDRAAAAGEHKVYDENRSIFVGNLPFDIKDETLWSAFLQCGNIEAVRVVRDKGTGAGKGFGYILFHKIEGKEKALALTNVEVDGRQLRIKCVEGGKKKKPRQPPTSFQNAMKRAAFKEKKKRDDNPNSRKTLKKLMNRNKQQHEKKKIASIFSKFSKK